MSRAALLLVVGEAFNDKQKTLILDKIADDLQSWDDEGARCDLEKELENFAAEMKSFGDVAVSGTALANNSDNLSISILFSPDRKLLHDSLQNFLLLDSHYRYLVYAGQTIAGSGSWILPDDVFTFRNFVKILKDMDSVGVGGDGKGFALNVSSASEWDWNKNNFSRLSNLGVRLATAGSLSEKSRNFSNFRAFLDPLLIVVDTKDLLKASSTVGMINFSGPTLYIFPGGNGSSALFGVKGFTGLVDGGYSRKSCSWHFSRHLHQIDMVILSHLGVSNFLGMQSFLERKIETGSPDVGSIFFNCPEKFRKLSPNPESLKVNLFDAGAELSEKLTAVGLQPQPCFTPQPFQPITLYNKVGFGSVDMYVLNPVQNSEEMKSFLHQWSMRAESESFSAHSGVPLSNTISVSVLLVWKPFSPSAKIIRILFPGGTPQTKIFEGLDRLKNIPVFERSECSQTELCAKPPRAAQSRPTTLKPTTAKVNGNLEHKETAKPKPMNGSRDSMVGKVKADAREPVLAKTSAIQRATKVEPKKPEKTDTSPANGTPKADSKLTTKPVSPSKPLSPSKPVKDAAKTVPSRNVENLPSKRLAQKPSEAEASPKNKAAKASQPEAVKQIKPARRTEELKASETVKQTPASKQLNIAKEPSPAAKQLNSTKESRVTKHAEPVKQTKASAVSETAKQGTPKAAKASKEPEKKWTKQAVPKKPKQPESEKKDLEKESKEEVALIQPAEEVKQTKAPETVVSEPVCVAATAVEPTSAVPPEVGLIVANEVLGDGEAAPRAVDYDLPSPEDVAQMSQEDEDSFVEELPTEMEPGYGDQKDKDSGIAQTADQDLIVNHETRDDVMPDDRDVQAVHDFDQDDKVSNEKKVEGNEDFVYSREIPENLKSGEFTDDIDVARREIVEDKIDAELEEDLEFERDEEAVQNLNDSIEDAIVDEDQESAQLSHVQDPDVIPDHDISGVSELVTDETVKGVGDGKEEEDREDLISHDHEDVVHSTAAVDQNAERDQDVLEEAVAEDNDFEKEDMGKDHDLEERRDLEKEQCLEKEPNSWLLQESRSSLEHGGFQVKRATDGLARYCEEFGGSDEGEVAEDEERHAGDDLHEDHATCPGGIQVPAKKVDEEEEEDEGDELEAVEEEEETEEDEGAMIGIGRRTVPEIGCEVDVILSEDVAKGGYLPDVLGHEEHVGQQEDVELVGLSEAEATECPSSPVPKVQVDRNEELITEEGFGRGDDFGRGGVFGVNDQDFGKGEEDFGRAEQHLGRSDDFGRGGDFGVNDQDLGKGEEDFGRAEQHLGRSDDFGRGGDFGVNDQDLGKGEEDFGRAEQHLGRSDDFGRGGDFGVNDQDLGKGEEDFGRAEQHLGRSDDFGRGGDFGLNDQDLGKGDEDFFRAEQHLGRSDDFGRGGDFGVNDQDFGKGEEDFGRAEQDLGRGDDFDKVGDFGRREEDFRRDEDMMNDEEARRAEEEMIAEAEGKDDDASDVDLSESKEGLVAGERSDGSLSDNEAEEVEPGVRPLESMDDDVLPCALKKDTAIENLAAICAEMKEESSENAASLSSRELMAGEARPDLVAACEAFGPQDTETAIGTEEEDKALMEGQDVVEAEGTDGYVYRFETEQPQNLSMDEGISQGKPHDLHLFNPEDEEEEPSSCSSKLDDLAADLAHEVIQSSLAAQSLDASACFASGPVSVTPLNGTEKSEIEAHESAPETLEDVASLVNAMVDTVATNDSTSNGRFNYGFDDDRREDALAANSFDGASAVVPPAQYKSGEDSGESDLDEGQDACHQGQGGLELGNEQEDMGRFDEGFEESNGDEGPANVTELLHQRVENKTTESLLRTEDSEGPCAFAYGASGEVANEQEEPFGSAGGPASEKTVDNSRPLLDFDEDVSATHQMEFGNGCVEAQRDAMDAWQRNNLNPFLDPCSVEAGERENVEQDLHADGEARISSEAGYFQSMTASGVDSEEFYHKREGDEQSIPSDDNAEPVVPRSHEQDMVQSADERGSDDLKVTPEDEAAEISAQAEEDSLEANVTKSQVVEETSENRRTSSFWTYDDNVQSTESAAVRGTADNILFSEETTNDVERDINENLGVATGLEEEDGELVEDLEKVSTQSNASEEGESRSSAVLSEQHDGVESLDSDVEVDPVKSWGQPMGLPAPAQDSNRNKPKTTSRLNDAANLTLPVSVHDKKPPAKSNDRSFIAPQKKTSDVRKSGALKTAADPNESKDNGSLIKDAKTTITKKPVTSVAPVAKKQTTTSTDTSKSRPLKHVVPFYVDLTYIPGNGDPSYVDVDFFRRVRAHYYVLSSLDPDPRVLSCLVEGKQTWENKDLSVNVIPTHDSSALHRWFHENAKLVEELKISLLPAANKCTIKLQDKDDGCYAFRIEF